MSIDDGILMNRYHCYDCGAIHSSQGIEIFKSGDINKYVCKECGGRCILESELRVSKGHVKSKKQYFQNYSIFNFVIAFVILFVVSLIAYSFYQEQETKRDFQKYVVENEALRKDIEPYLIHYREDIKLIEKSLKTKVPENDVQMAENRLNRSKKLIMKNAWRTEEIIKPSTSEVIELYQSEVNFFSNPSYKNYIIYIGIFNKMEAKFKKDIVSSITQSIENSNRKKRLRNKKIKK